MRLKTARCILHRALPDAGGWEFLLAIHASFRYRRRQRWGFVGGAIERREDPTRAAIREVREELGIDLPAPIDIGDYRYKQTLHRVVAAPWSSVIPAMDERELLELRWFNRAGVRTLADTGALHAGYELDAIDALLARLHASEPAQAAGPATDR